MITMFNKIILVSGLLLSSLPSNAQADWSRLPKDQWPTIALTNHVRFKNGDTYIDPSFKYAGTGFLIAYENMKYAVTAKHVLWIARRRDQRSVKINDDLAQWVMKTKVPSKDSVVVDRLLNEDPAEVLDGPASSILERDMLVFSVRTSSENILGLTPRFSAAKAGEKVFMIGNPYQSATTTTAESKVVRKLGMDILIEQNADIQYPGLSGSPVVDANGLVIGVFSSTSFDPVSGKNVIVLTSMEYFKRVLERKSDLNKPKIDYGAVILDAVLKKGVKSAISLYKKLAADPGNYYKYNLRSANRNGLLETGQKLLEMVRTQDAIAILEFNVSLNSSYFHNYNVLAKAYLQAGNKEKAIECYRRSIEKFDDKEENEAFEELKRLTPNNQSYRSWFLNKNRIDSLVSKGNYIAAIPSFRICTSEADMTTVEDEFYFGYALFKAGNIDSAALFLKKALMNGFHFHDLAQFKYWEENDVFRKMQTHKILADVPDLLRNNTTAYISQTPDSSLKAALLEARVKDQRFRGPGADYTKQRPLDIENQEFLRRVIKEHGWPNEDMVGYDGANAAFLIAQHSDNDPDFQRECMTHIQQAYYSQKIDPSSYAYIIDRTRVNMAKPQLFGTQFEETYEKGEFDLKLKPVEDIEYLDARRKVFRLRPVADYLADSKARLRPR